MSLINISNLTFAYDGSYDNIFENVSLQMDTNWKLGFTGRNGRGKTTFMKLLMGKYEYKGKISSSVNFDYFPFFVEDDQLVTMDVINNINSEYDLWELLKEFSILKIGDEVLYRKFNTLSNGEQTKVLLATLFLKENNFLLIDEPTNHLDSNGRMIVSNYLKSKKGFILISHDRTFLDNSIDHILAINKNDIEVQSGNFSSWFYNKSLKDNFEINQNTKLKKDIDRLSESAKRTSSWSNDVEKTKYNSGNMDRGYIGHKSAKMMKRSKSIESRQKTAIDEKSKLLKNIERIDSLKIKVIDHPKNTLISFNNVSILYNEKSVCKNINFTVNSGDRVAISGINGTGKSSILKLIIGENIDYEGRLNIATNLKISYVSQDTSFLKGNLTDYAKEYGIDESLFKAILRKLDFSRIQFEKDMRNFSEGQKKKVLIARSLSEEAHIFIWDEPLNFIDVFSRMQIEELLKNFNLTMIFVEHDILFRKLIANKEINI